jgi:hypothetical protein
MPRPYLPTTVNHWPLIANHWPLIAQEFEMDPDYPALALHCTTVNSDPWMGPYNEEKDEYGPYDWTQAWDVYAELDALKLEPTRA